MELVLGHVTWYQNLRRGVEALDLVESKWVETTLYDPNGFLERAPGVPGVVRAGVRGWLDTHRGLRGWAPDALVFNTHKIAMLCQWDMLRTPSILITDVTPAQYDRLADLYDHKVDASGAVRAAKHALNSLNFRLAGGLAVSSNWTRDSLIDEYGVAPERVHVIPIGVDTDYWRPRSAPRAQPERVQLLFVGGHFERKGGRLLLDAFRALRLHERAELHVVTRDQIQPEPGVVIHGGLRNNSEELRQLYQQADVFVIPTLADCFSNVSLEAMASGLPVIATNMGGIPDIVAHGQTGILLEPGNARQLAEALSKLVDNAQTRVAFGAAARRRALSHFDARANAGRILDLAADLVQERRTRWPVLKPTDS